MDIVGMPGFSRVEDDGWADIEGTLNVVSSPPKGAYKHTREPLAESRGHVNFGLIGSEFGETSYPVCGTSAASAYSHGKEAGGTDDVSQRDGGFKFRSEHQRLLRGNHGENARRSG